VCGLFCVANGALVGITIGIKELLSGNYKRAAIWLLAFGSYLIWIFSLSSSQGMPEAQAPVAFITLANYFLCLIGSAFGFFNQQIALTFGIVFTLLFIYFFLKQQHSKNPILFYLLVFIFLSAFTNTLGRAALGIDVAYTSSRYSIYSVVIAVVNVILLQDEYRSQQIKKVFCYSIFLLSLSYALLSIRVYQPWYALTSQRVTDSISRWKTVKDGLLFYIPAQATKWLHEADKHNLISHPHDAIKTAQQLEVTQKSQQTAAYSSFENVHVSQSHIAIDGWLIIPKINMSETIIRLRLVNSQSSYTYTTELRERPDVARHHYNCCQMTATKDSGFHLIIDRSALIPGTYSLYAIVEYQNQLLRVDLKKEILL
jgi:hypothetical protein